MPAARAIPAAMWTEELTKPENVARFVTSMAAGVVVVLISTYIIKKGA